MDRATILECFNKCNNREDFVRMDGLCAPKCWTWYCMKCGDEHPETLGCEWGLFQMRFIEPVNGTQNFYDLFTKDMKEDTKKTIKQGFEDFGLLKEK